ncbi:MAG: copper amine oxidase N-terminal domain-containing protein [Cytophagales bacterium]|nr:copper amine oxidase N-terminal domain-containing protein [Armatimonadota bacterium]
MPYLIQGNAVTLGAEPTLMNNKHYVPLRDVVEALGGSVDFDNEAKVAHAKVGPWDAVLTMGDQNVTVSGNGTNTPVTLTAPPYVEGDQFFVPFDFLRDAYGYNVSFEGETLTIVNPNAA